MEGDEEKTSVDREALWRIIPYQGTGPAAVTPWPAGASVPRKVRDCGEVSWKRTRDGQVSGNILTCSTVNAVTLLHA